MIHNTCINIKLYIYVQILFIITYTQILESFQTSNSRATISTLEVTDFSLQNYDDCEKEVEYKNNTFK